MKVPLNKICWIHLTVGAFILMGVSFWNGFPLLYSDSSTYLSSGFDLETPYDRPINYGLIIRATSLNGLSVWFTIFFQSLLLSYLVYKTIKNTIGYVKIWQFYVAIIFLELFTVIGFVTGQLITDIFMAICILSIVNLVLYQNTKKENILLYTIFFIATATHMSHVGINIIFLSSIIFLFVLFKQVKNIIFFKRILILLFLSVLSILTMGSTLSKSKHVFVLARMAGSGMLQQYLMESCGEKGYKLCNEIDKIPLNTNDFLWEDDSPFNIEYNSWKDSKEDFEDIISETFSSWKYIKLHIRDFFNNGFHQLTRFNAGDGNGAFKEDNILSERLNKFTYTDINFYKNSKQYNAQALNDNFFELNLFYKIIVFLSFLALLIIISIKKTRLLIGSKCLLVIALLMLSLIINAFFNAGLVVVADRFGAKIIWFIPFLLVITVFKLFKKV